MSTAKMMPIVFCASLPPCPRLYAAADTSCNLRKSLPTRDGDARRKIQYVAIMNSQPSARPMNGATKMNAPIFNNPAGTSAFGPPAASAAPANPPTSACDELDGNAHHHVSRFQTIAPISAAVITESVMYCG